MANHPNRDRRAYRIIIGATMTAGYEDDLGPRRLKVVVENGKAWPWDDWAGCIDRDDGPYLVDADGMLAMPEAVAGYGFLPNEGELARIGIER